MKEVSNADLKQFIAKELLEMRQEMAAIEKRLQTRITVEVNAMGVRLMAEIDELNASVNQISDNMAGLELRLVRRFDKKIDRLSASIAEALDSANERHGEWLNDHEHRLYRLEGNRQRSQQPHLARSARIKA